MTPEEAIKSLTLENKYPWNMDKSPLRKAVQLGIEALKLNNEMRVTYANPEIFELPGETED